MSAVVSEAPVAEPTSAALVESGEDAHETQMTYDTSSHVPWWVVLVWVCSMTGFLAYTVLFLFPDLAKWGAP